FSLAEDTDDLFVGKTLLHGDVLMWLMKTLLTSWCINQRGAGHCLFRRENAGGFGVTARRTPGINCQASNKQRNLMRKHGVFFCLQFRKSDQTPPGSGDSCRVPRTHLPATAT
ncbi:hypothetical protein, partial [Raoultella terrigena]|uniref:hypothetical protein n=1 Tax=Raoultella terrigena TaxID=577 RepID=UPI002DC05546